MSKSLFFFSYVGSVMAGGHRCLTVYKMEAMSMRSCIVQSVFHARHSEKKR